MVAGILALVMLAIRLFPETPLGRSLHRWFVEWPVDLAARMERRHVILIVIILCCGQTLALLGSADIALAYAVDLSAYADAALAVYLASFAARLRGVAFVCSSRVRQIAARLRRPRARAVRSQPRPGLERKPSNDDDPHWRGVPAAA